MPARIVITSTGAELAKLFSLDTHCDLSAVSRARYNVAPQQDVPVVRITNGARELANLRWGLIPHWNSDPTLEGHVNARSETVSQKPSFRDAFQSRRCLVPANGFYGWKPGPSRKQPFFFQPSGGGLFVCAGIWERWESVEGTFETVAVLTMPSNALVMPMDPRMPVVVNESDFAAWLDPHTPTPEKLLKTFKPFPAEQMECWPVSTRVNDPANDDPQLLAPISLPNASPKRKPTT